MDVIALTRQLGAAIQQDARYADYMKAKALLKFQNEAFIEWNEFKYLKMILQITRMRLDEIGVFSDE